MEKAQGALEYLLLIGGAILVVVIVIALLLSTGQSGKESAESGMAKWEEEIKKASGGAYVKNSGFELVGETGEGDALNWTEYAGHSRSSDSEKAYKGRYSLKADATGSNEGKTSVTVSDAINVESGKSYKISAYIWNDLSAGASYIDIKAYNGLNDPSWSCDAPQDATDPYAGIINENDKGNWFYVECITKEAVPVMQVQIRLITDRNPSGTAYFDDIKIEPV